MPSSVRATYSLRVLGSFALLRNGGRVTVRPGAQRLPTLLAVCGEHDREAAAGVLWPDRPAARAHANLRTVLWRLRDAAPDLVSEDAGVLYLDDNVTADLYRLRDWARQAVRGDDPAQPAPDEPAATLLPGWDDSWLDGPRRELRLLCQYALETMANRLLLGGRLGEAATVATLAAAIDPLREVPVRLLIEVHLRENDHVAAHRRFHEFRRLLSSEIGTEPSAILAGLIRQAPRSDGQNRITGVHGDVGVGFRGGAVVRRY